MKSYEEIWQYYELGKQYNSNLSPNQYSVVHTNNEFFNGNQWIHLPKTPAMQRLAKPVFNIIKRVTSLFVASLTSSNTTISFEPLSYQDDSDAAAFATAEVRNLLEKFKIDYRIRDALFDGAITGDYAAHFFWNPDAQPYGGAFGEYRGEIEMEMVDGINVMFGNPNLRDVERQPYVLIVGRDTVESLKKEAEAWRMRTAAAGTEDSPAGGTPSVDFVDSSLKEGAGLRAEEVYIRPDSEFADYAGSGQNEIRGRDDKTAKALYLYYYTKVPKEIQEVDPVTGMTVTKTVTTVHVTKTTRTAAIFEDVDTGLTRYPVAWGNWQRQRNQYHGRALVTEIIPNQIFINQMMAMVFRHLQTQAFPTKIYNADLLPNISNEVGTSIGVRNVRPGEKVEDIIATIPASDMSSQIIQAIELCLSYTKECLGATDAQMGNVKPDNTSALMVLQNASEVPLENTRAGLHEWVEDIGAILLDMMGNYYGIRPIVREKTFEEPVMGADGMVQLDPMTGQIATKSVSRRVIEEYDFRVFRRLWLNVSVDVGATTYYSEIAMVQTLDNLRHDGTLNVIEYLERMPDKLITRKQELIGALKARMGTEETAASGKAGTQTETNYAVGGELDAAKQLSQLPTGMQAKYNSLPKVAQRALVNG